MTSSAQFKTWLDANTLYQSRQRAWADDFTIHG